jgi:hypothetical protein
VISALQETACWDDFYIVMATLESGSAAAVSIAQKICQVYNRVTSTTPPILLQGAC